MLTLLATALMLWIVLGTWGLVRTAAGPPSEAFGHALASGKPTDPGEAGFAWTEDVYRARDGVDLPLWRIEGGAADGPTLIVLHDWGSSPIALLGGIRDTLPSIKAALLPTLRGHGAHTGRCSLGPREIDDLKTLLATLDDPVVLRGNGLGGLIAGGCAEETCVSRVETTNCWKNQTDGLCRILSLRGQPAFPFAWIARICLP